MKTTTLLWLAACASLALVGGWARMAASQTEPTMTFEAPQLRLGVIDVARVLKESKKFSQMIESTKFEHRSVENPEADYWAEVIKKHLGHLQPNTPEYQARLEELRRRSSPFDYRRSLLKKDFLDLETNVYRMIYQEIQAEVAAVADELGIGMVFRNNGGPVDERNREEVQRYLSKGIISVDPQFDITDTVLERLNKGAEKEGPIHVIMPFTPIVEKQAVAIAPPASPSTPVVEKRYTRYPGWRFRR